jgi:ribonuclease BN (tRNA processing enzyme)
MKLVVLGSGTVAPTPERTAPAYWVEAGPVKLLLDCGAGMLHRAAAFGVPWAEATHVAISHFHPDHWGELAAYLFALRWGIEPARSTPLTLLGPPGFRLRLERLAGAFGDWVLEPEFRQELVEIAPGETRELAAGITLEACDTPHTAESVAFAVRTGDAHLVYTGDTGPSGAIELHLTPTQAGALAQAAGARRLVLTHFYPVFGETDPAEVAAREFDGEVVAAQDGDRFIVGT